MTELLPLLLFLKVLLTSQSKAFLSGVLCAGQLRVFVLVEAFR